MSRLLTFLVIILAIALGAAIYSDKPENADAPNENTEVNSEVTQ